MTVHIAAPGGGSYHKVPVVKALGEDFPHRELNPKAIQAMQARDADPRLLTIAALTQVGDQNNILWAALLSLAKDVYSNLNPVLASTHFKKFVDDNGLMVTAADNKRISAAQELDKVIPEPRAASLGSDAPTTILDTALAKG